MSDCIFCRLAVGEIPSKKLFEDDRVVAFYDIKPAAPVHFQVIPKQHIPAASALGPETEALVGYLFTVIARVTAELGLTDYRVINNCGPGAGQTVPHLHFHVLAGCEMGECLL